MTPKPSGAFHYVKGDATCPNRPAPIIIAHVCNDVGAWGRGFVLALSKKWPGAEAAYRTWAQGKNEPFGLGRTQFVEVEPGIWIANMVAQHDIRTKNGVAPIRYAALGYCLETLAAKALELGASVHAPRFGSGLAGGDWHRVAALIKAHLVLGGVFVTVYDLPESTGGGR